MQKPVSGVAPAERERAYRHKVFQPATLRTTSGEYRCHLLNLSHTGMCVHCDADLPDDTRIVVICDGHMLAARIRWREAGKYGAQFVQPLGPTTLNRLIPASVAA
ncbi:PilZ domain-containing protein [Stakelama pacifica]|uniref:PilZ domain-containing protein n=1 Tax=Stakelama pacifica TaxID=517720 RepID=A0A4V3BSQ2_9SPHN|nr:PilZ domain-containing protein [Stakelama pacifica]TDN80248.1 PilZ domain-containing protein [Stakelama pacifica]GGO97763.1 hypothetical protein GCM10011329_27370 [Stakelama pacifica]